MRSLMLLAITLTPSAALAIPLETRVIAAEATDPLAIANVSTLLLPEVRTTPDRTILLAGLDDAPGVTALNNVVAFTAGTKPTLLLRNGTPFTNDPTTALQVTSPQSRFATNIARNLVFATTANDAVVGGRTSTVLGVLDDNSPAILLREDDPMPDISGAELSPCLSSFDIRLNQAGTAALWLPISFPGAPVVAAEWAVYRYANDTFNVLTYSQKHEPLLENAIVDQTNVAGITDTDTIVYFVGGLTDTDRHEAIVSHGVDAARIVARRRDPVPDGLANEKYLRLDRQIAVNAHGSIAFTAATNLTTPASTTLNRDLGSGPLVLARADTPCPPANNAIYSSFLPQPLIAPDDTVCFTAYFDVGQAGVTTSNDTALLVHDGTSAHLVAREGDLAAGSTNLEYALPKAAGVNTRGDVLFQSELRNASGHIVAEAQFIHVAALDQSFPTSLVGSTLDVSTTPNLPDPRTVATIVLDRFPGLSNTLSEEGSFINEVRFTDGSTAIVTQTIAPTPCSPADLTPPFNQLDLSDTDTFIAAFLNQDPLADLVAPLGLIDLDDVDTFITAFLAGCP